MKKLLSVFVLLFGLTYVYGGSAPDTPRDFSNPDATDHSLTFEWRGPLDVDWYNIYLVSRTPTGTVYTLVKTVTGQSNTTAIITEIPVPKKDPIPLAQNTPYHFAVTSENSLGESAPTAPSIFAKTTHTWDGELLSCLGAGLSTPPTRTELSSINIFECTGKNLTTMAPIEDLNQNIIFLNLYNNDIIGTIPSWMTDRTSLKSLYLDYNDLTGSIPAEIGNLGSLTSLNLSENNLTGSIPAEIGNLGSLTSLSLSENNLTGSIPAKIGNDTNLTSLDLSYNNLTGSIPAEIGNLGSLTSLNLSGNNLTGNIPAKIGNLGSLISLDLSYNDLTGEIPTSIEDLSEINYLALNDNCNLYTNEPSLQAFIDATPSEHDYEYQDILNSNSHDCNRFNPSVMMYLLD